MIGKRLPRSVLNTRPLADAREISDRLNALGFNVISEPLLQISFHDRAAPSLEGVQALVFTSRNGVRAYTRSVAARDLPVFAVGDGTADFARSEGFGCVRSAAGNVESLVSLIVDVASPNDGRLLHVAGTISAGEMSVRLREFGFDLVREVMYESRMSERLSTRTIENFKAGEIDDIVLFSPRTARTFAKLFNEAGLQDCGPSLTLYCLSEAVVEGVKEYPWGKLLIAAEPNLGALLELFGEAGVKNGK